MEEKEEKEENGECRMQDGRREDAGGCRREEDGGCRRRQRMEG